MEVINPKDFNIDSLYICSILNQRTKARDNKELTKTQQKMLFETICAGLIESWNADEGLCIEALMKFIDFSINYEIPNTQFSEPIANIIFQLLSTDHLFVVQKSLNLVLNIFSQKTLNTIAQILLNNNIVGIIHELFIKWETQIFPEILYIFSNLAGTSMVCRNLILTCFNPTEIKNLLIGINNEQNFLRGKIRAFFREFLSYQLNYEDALSIFNLLAEVRTQLGNWVFEQMGLCFKWINDLSIIDPELIGEAFESLQSDSDEDIKAALVFISYTTKDINETVVNLLNNEDEKISRLATWAVSNYVKSNKSNGVNICKEYNVFQTLQITFLNGSFRQKVESSYCLCDILRESTLADKMEIMSIGLCSDLAEMLSIGGDDKLSVEIIKTFIELLSHQENEELIPEIIKIFGEKFIYTKLADEVSSSNEKLAEASLKLTSIIESIE